MGLHNGQSATGAPSVYLFLFKSYQRKIANVNVNSSRKFKTRLYICLLSSVFIKSYPGTFFSFVYSPTLLL